MKLIGIFTSMAGTLLMLAGIGPFSSPMFAQGRMEGKFKLSQEVQWGSSKLPKGEYSYSVDSGNSPAVVQVQQTNGNFSESFISKAIVGGKYSGPSGVIVRRIGAEDFVSALRVNGFAQLDFPVPAVSVNGQPNTPRATSRPVMLEFFNFDNARHEKVSVGEIEKVYLSACEAVEREFNRSESVRPAMTLRLGANENFLHYDTREITLRKWNEYAFAEAVVALAMNDFATIEERQKLSNIAVGRAASTVNVCELKHCRN